MQLDFHVNVNNVELRPQIAEKAASFAIKRALDTMKTQLVRETVPRYFVTASSIRKTITMKYSLSSRAAQGLIISRAPRIPLSKFKISPKSPSYRMKGKSYRAAVRRDGGLKSLSPNSFYIPKSQSMWRRIAPGGRNFKNLRFMLGPAIPQMLKNEETLNEIKNKAEQVFTQRFSHEIERLLYA